MDGLRRTVLLFNAELAPGESGEMLGPVQHRSLSDAFGPGSGTERPADVHADREIGSPPDIQSMGDMVNPLALLLVTLVLLGELAKACFDGHSPGVYFLNTHLPY